MDLASFLPLSLCSLSLSSGRTNSTIDSGTYALGYGGIEIFTAGV